jgi:GT2 family glycosyltransferase
MSNLDFTEKPPELNLQMVAESDEIVSVIIIHNDKPAYLSLCLQSIAVASKNNNYEIVIVDNASKMQDSIALLDAMEKHDECKVIRNTENLGWTKAANQGAKATNPASKYFIFLHHDVVILNHAWIDYFINISESNDAGIVGISKATYSQEDVSGKKLKMDYLEEWCLFTTRECWEDCGPFNEKLFQVGAPFIYCLTANLNNYHPQHVRNTMVHHWGITSMSVSDLERYMDQARNLLPTLIRDQQIKFSNKV